MKTEQNLKGIVLAGGTGSRLYPITLGVSKQLLPVYDKPMIYYPISVLMLAGIRDILIITTRQDQPSFQRLLGDGSQLGVSFSYCIQESAEGLAQAFLLAEQFIANSHVCLVLGDNIFYGHGLPQLLEKAKTNLAEHNSSTVFGYPVSNPSRYGVVEFNNQGKAISIEEKPQQPKSRYAVTGLYFYPNDVVKKAKQVQPSARGELEITTINQMFLTEKRLDVQIMSRGFAWLDTGTHESLLQASAYIETIEKRQGLKVACLEEIAFEMNYINKAQLLELAKPLASNEYGKYLAYIASGEEGKSL